MRVLLSVILFFVFVVSLCGQNINYAHKIIDTLASPYFTGRGVVEQGELKAAKFIARQMEEIGLQKINNNYFQQYKYPVNIFPGDMRVLIDGVPLKPGYEFLVTPYSESAEGTFQIIWYNKDNLPSAKVFAKLKKKDFFANKAVVLDTKELDTQSDVIKNIQQNTIGASLIVEIKDKLTWGASPGYMPIAKVEILRDKIKRGAQQIEVHIEAQFMPKHLAKNVIGYVKGTQYPDSFLVITAHYDHLGKMGKDVYFPGANDNASGVSMMLDLANYFNSNPLKYSVLFIAFSGEEAGLQGSKYFTQHPVVELEKMRFLVNLDLVGTGEEGIQVVNGAVLQNEFIRLQTINQVKQYLPAVKKRAKAANSDHYFFFEKGVPSFFIYTLGGIDAYHDVYDKPETLPLTEFEDLEHLIIDFLKSF
jgi:Iap family predicted aminopeptidase